MTSEQSTLGTQFGVFPLFFEETPRPKRRRGGVGGNHRRYAKLGLLLAWPLLAGRLRSPVSPHPLSRTCCNGNDTLAYAGTETHPRVLSTSTCQGGWSSPLASASM